MPVTIFGQAGQPVELHGTQRDYLAEAIPILAERWGLRLDPETTTLENLAERLLLLAQNGETPLEKRDRKEQSRTRMTDSEMPASIELSHLVRPARRRPERLNRREALTLEQWDGTPR